MRHYAAKCRTHYHPNIVIIIIGEMDELNTVSISCTHADSGASCTDADNAEHQVEHHG